MNNQQFADMMVEKITDKMKQWDEGVNTAQAAIDGLELGATIDEVALRFENESSLMMFLKHAVTIEGVNLFNYAVDHVETYPIRSNYDVRYWFLTTPKGYRLECMIIDPVGFSPLHQAHTMRTGYEEPVHYSFKCFDEEQYDMARRIIEGSEWVLAQNNHSTYGSFAYYLTGETTDYALEKAGFKWSNAYIKPRMNTRDSYPRNGLLDGVTTPNEELSAKINKSASGLIETANRAKDAGNKKYGGVTKAAQEYLGSKA